MLSLSGLFDQAGDSRDKQRIMMTEERWIDQHNSLFTMKSVNVTFEASININNDDMMLGNYCKLELLIELCYHKSVIVVQIFYFHFPRNVSSEASEASVSDGVS